ncbi:hypothetical protein [uncultured Lacinutrix sp.]|uniref:hypothetical protein n=1 Tax=uncultured Lacinutrix sp. TaxID=574032 RepID=UPI002635A39E|nr:hypothetical protein [uncultured Lacinutrix sp.]
MKEKLDSISIELLVQACQLDAQDIWFQGDLEIRINGIKPYAEMSDIIDVDVFLKSLETDGEYYIFSCICGIPECSGWINGISVRHKEQTIVWTNENTKEVWTLDKSKIEKDLAEIRNEVENYKNYFNEKKIKYVGVGYNW